MDETWELRQRVVIQAIPRFLAWAVVVEMGVPSSETGNPEEKQVCMGG